MPKGENIENRVVTRKCAGHDAPYDPLGCSARHDGMADVVVGYCWLSIPVRNWGVQGNQISMRKFGLDGPILTSSFLRLDQY